MTHPFDLRSSARTSHKLTYLLARAFRKAGLHRLLHVSIAIQTPGGKFHIPLRDGHGEVLLGAIQGFKADLLRHLRCRGLWERAVVDVGVNIGQTILEVFCSGVAIDSYHGFEPSLEALYVARSLVMRNPAMASSVHLYPWGCSNAAAPLQLFRTSELDSGATCRPAIRPDTYAGLSGSLIAGYPLDLVASELALPQRFLLKIDVEGAELTVLEGARSTIERFRPIIQCEVLHAHRESERAMNDQHKAQILLLLREMRYCPLLIKLPPKGMSRMLGLVELEEGFFSGLWSEAPHTCDYVFAPNEVVGVLLEH